MFELNRSERLRNISYEIRGKIAVQAQKMEDSGEEILKLNIGNLSFFGFEPSGFVNDFISDNIQKCGRYTESSGLLGARNQVFRYNRFKDFRNFEVEDIFLGNGVSELVSIVLSSLLNVGDEVLVPAPDYPLWTASVKLNEGRAVHYLCDESDGWQPNVEDIESKITDRTRAVVVVNPNNPTGAVYSREILLEIVAVAKRYSLLILADEVYDQILFDGNTHTSLASLDEEALVVTFNGLSKNFRACGFRSGWITISGDKSRSRDFIEGIRVLSSMRLCSNVFGQLAIEASLLEFFQSRDGLNEMIDKLSDRRDSAVQAIGKIEGLSAVIPKGSMYIFPRIDTEIYRIEDDKQFMLDFLTEQRVMMVQGTGFNWNKPDHFRIVMLPEPQVLRDAIERLGVFLSKYRQL